MPEKRTDVGCWRLPTSGGLSVWTCLAGSWCPTVSLEWAGISPDEA